MPLYLSLTDAGLAAVEGASGSDPAIIAELGLTATPFTVAPTLIALPGEFKRISAVAGTEAAPNVTHMTAYDTSSDVWNATGLGLFLEDGTLFAVYSSTSTIISKAAAAFALVALDIAFNADLAGSIAFGDPIFTNPPATTEMRGLVELATAPEAETGTDTERALTPAGAKAAVLAWLLTMDGAGSGLDADLLDGQHGTWYADIAARLGYTPLNAASYTAADVLAKLLTVDGSGSGIDADLLDGFNSTAFRRVTASNITENGGYIVYSDGLKETWGYVDVGADSSAVYTLPVEHSSWVNATLGIEVQSGDTNNSENTGIASRAVGPGGNVTIYSAENFAMRVFIQTRGV